MWKVKKKIINITTNKLVDKTLAKYNGVFGYNRLFYIKFLKKLFVLLKL